MAFRSDPLWNGSVFDSSGVDFDWPDPLFVIDLWLKLPDPGTSGGSFLALDRPVLQGSCI